MADIITIPIGDARYPLLLARLPQPPEMLYVRGNADALLLPLMVAVVGTRRMTRYGETAAKRVAGAMASCGIAVVSGLALGIDAVAHAATLDAGGITVAVLGTGVDSASVSPRSNWRLAERIITSGGAIVSEYPSGTGGMPYHFPARNRIVAGLCRAVAVIEAPEKSGALITARYALDADRDVFALPGPITSPASRGTNLFIAGGAIPILDEATIPAYYGRIDEKPAPAIAITDSERAIIAAIDAGAPNVDVIAEKTALPINELLAILSSLELTGIIVRNGAFYLCTLTKRGRSR